MTDEWKIIKSIQQIRSTNSIEEKLVLFDLLNVDMLLKGIKYCFFPFTYNSTIGEGIGLGLIDGRKPKIINGDIIGCHSDLVLICSKTYVYLFKDRFDLCKSGMINTFFEKRVYTIFNTYNASALRAMINAFIDDASS